MSRFTSYDLFFVFKFEVSNVRKLNFSLVYRNQYSRGVSRAECGIFLLRVAVDFF